MNVAIATWAAPSASAVMTARTGGSPADDVAGTGTLASASTTVPSGTAGATAPPPIETPLPSPSGNGEGGKDDPLVNRYPRIGVSFNSEASRLIILFRDPATGKAIDQIPSEVALKQYIDAQQKEKAGPPPRYDTVVGAAQAGGQADGGERPTAGTAGGQAGSPSRTDSGGAAHGSGSSTHTASLRLAAVNGTLPAAGAAASTVRVQAPAGGAVSGGASRGLNLTI